LAARSRSSGLAAINWQNGIAVYGLEADLGSCRLPKKSSLRHPISPASSRRRGPSRRAASATLFRSSLARGHRRQSRNRAYPRAAGFRIGRLRFRVGRWLRCLSGRRWLSVAVSTLP